MRYPFGVCSGVWCCSLVFFLLFHFICFLLFPAFLFYFFSFLLFHLFHMVLGFLLLSSYSCAVFIRSFLSLPYFLIFFISSLHLAPFSYGHLFFFWVLFLFVLLCLLCLPYFTTHPSSCLSLCTSSIGQIWCCFIFKLFTLSCFVALLLYLSTFEKVILK